MRLISIFLLICLECHALTLAECEKIFLKNFDIKSLIAAEKAKENPSSDYIKQLRQIRNCSDLLDKATLKTNGMIKDRNPIGQKVLETFVDFHQSWVMPESPERIQICQDKYQWDVYDKKTPSYHLTRALFQEDRDAKLVLTGYGDLRSVRAGENPKKSALTGISDEEYQEFFGTKDKFQFSSKQPIIGFLYKRKLTATNFKKARKPQALVAQENWPKENLNIYKHFGGGILGSPSFLYQYGQRTPFYRSNGRQLLPRRYANAIWNNLLCNEPNANLDTVPAKDSTWNHPITQEVNCLSCHKPLDEMASAFRHITFLPTRKNCDADSPQVLIPFSFKATGAVNVWSPKDQGSRVQEQSTKSSPPFHLSYPVAYHSGQRVVGLAQLGKALANDPRFYRCQVIKYYQLVHNETPSQSFLEKATRQYQENQNGLTLLKSIVARRKK